jgi:ComF family protein
VRQTTEPPARWWSRARSAAFDLLLPPRCGACDVELPEEREPGTPFCGACVAALPLTAWPTCVRCAALVPAAGEAALECNHCRDAKLRFERTLAVGRYDGLLRDLVMRMKADRSERLAHQLAELAWRELGPRLAALEVDVVTAVPMHPWRRWKRGVNPPLAIAEKLAKRLGAPAAGGMLRLRRNVPPQIGLSRPARFRNVHNEMTMRPGYHLEAAHVMVVDDILTTGATCSEAARVLKRAGAAEVTVVVVARTPADG